MSKFESCSFIVYGIIFLVIVIVLYNLFDWIFCLVMSNTYQFGFYHSVAVPVGIVVYILMVIQKPKKKD